MGASLASCLFLLSLLVVVVAAGSGVVSAVLLTRCSTTSPDDRASNAGTLRPGVVVAACCLAVSAVVAVIVRLSVRMVGGRRGHRGRWGHLWSAVVFDGDRFGGTATHVIGGGGVVGKMSVVEYE